MSKLKYLLILIVPISGVIAFYSNGWLTYLTLFIVFLIAPLIELFIKPNHNNLSSIEVEIAQNDNFYRFLLYLIVPIQLICLLIYLNTWNQDYSTFEMIGRIMSMGILCGVLGINVGHELGHKKKRFEQFLGEILLLTSLENHFLIYHNFGHHFEVATPNDPATARKNEWLFTFWFRSQIGSYIKAWKLQHKILGVQKKGWLTTHNKMLWYSLASAIICLLIAFTFSFTIMFYFIAAALIGILLLETVNYIEHYGLLRKQKESGRYEIVNPTHSWNSDHVIGRLLLFELSRHSDHHHRASKPYQILDSHKNSPQMKTGYPGMMFVALFPPLFFKLMNKELSKYQSI